MLQEVAIQSLADEVNAMLDSAATIAREEGIYLALPVRLTLSKGRFENVVRNFDPNGNVVLEHLKFGGAQFEGSVSGSGELQIVDAPYGRLSAAICWDAGFPDVIRQAGAMNVDLPLHPSNDWFAIRSLHPQMATFRAVENGMAIFRQTANGVSSVIDQYGRVINRVDIYVQDPDAWDGLQIVDVPMGAVDTLYPETSDVIGLASLASLASFLGLLGLALFKRHGRDTQAVA
ncbi:nitrilase-related carbon-nitrogen hydrolase [Yoonia sp. SDW83-1]|uniref:nitrilase-related carbon-nitrogen hydrolase n=1 Tax=Yoonia sp. SDW83-1 TaxID=3366945 RepID=UPI00398C2F6A